MEPIAGTTSGKVRGRLADGVAAYLGIPYAAPPFGANRFRPPRPAATWDGVRDALEYGPTAPKPGYPRPYDVLLPDPRIDGEDCLNLNVWAPADGGGGLPVMVWIHGGAFRNGSGAVPIYNGSRFARDGVVCVTVNYRLGVEGFANLPGAPANRGLLDQIAALRWVKENIAAFGGDPGNVTVFGESAGAMSVLTLLSLDLAAKEGLFRRAIAQSGGAGVAQDAGDAMNVTRAIAEKLGVGPTAEAFAAIDPAEVVKAQAAVAAEVAALPDPGRWGRTTASSGMALMPILDGELVTETPEAALARGAAQGVDLLIGATSEEFRLFFVPTGLAGMVTDEINAAIVRGLGIDPGLLAAHADMGPGDALCATVTDAFFRHPARRVAAAHDPSYLYEFAWRTAERDMGACHALELGFVFDTLDAREGHGLAGPNPPQVLADAMHSAWVAFAATGDPGWKAYDETAKAVKYFDGVADPVVNTA